MRETINIKDLQNRDASAFKSLFTQVFPHLRFYSQKIVNDSLDAEDIASQSFTKCLERIAEFDSIEAVKNFLYTTARNASIDHLKKKKAAINYQNHLVHLSGQAMEEELKKIGCETFMLEDLYAQLIHHVETLPDQERAVFKKVFFDKISRPEVANQLQISVGTVNVHVSNAMKKLRSIFTEKDMAIISLILIGYSQN